ncbi:MAG: hypothetical protein AAF355_14295 [Myxococcota bacterium]
MPPSALSTAQHMSLEHAYLLYANHRLEARAQRYGTATDSFSSTGLTDTDTPYQANLYALAKALTVSQVVRSNALAGSSFHRVNLNFRCSHQRISKIE